MSNLHRLELVSTAIDTVIGYLCIIFGMAMTVSTLIGILFRYVMTNPLPWTEELARYAMIWMGLLAVSMGVRRESHLGLNIVANLLPAAVQKVLRYIVRILIGVFLYFLMVYGYTMAANGMHQTMPALRLPMICILAAVPACALFSLIQLALISAIDFIGKGE